MASVKSAPYGARRSTIRTCPHLRPHIYRHSRVHGYVPCGFVRPTGACAPPRVTLHHEAGSVAVESALVLDHDGATTFAKSQRSQQVGIWVV